MKRVVQMKKLWVVFSMFFITGFTFAQQADNALQGYFEEQGNETFYKGFSFDGNGKVAGGISNGYYFTRNDSLIVFPDKDIFIFKIKKGKLIGISDWVKKGVWAPKKDSSEVNNRKDPEEAQRKAALLAAFYDKTKNRSALDALFSDDLLNINEDFCNRGLPKACLNTFGIKMVKYTPGLLEGDPEKIKEKKLKPHPELIRLSQKIVSLGETEGYNVLGAYYMILGLQDKALETWEEGEKHGDMASALSRGLLDLGEDMDKENSSDRTIKSKKK
ncbi:hypothetical protein DRF59_19875 [Chryseobacterium flavum]|uniref:Tetratricopeptide repeat protein n=2 Tax=Chryseobacterium flavum TaxID=415851 RepID=A0A3D9CFZ1_9FLAO|nr:hypothetical protein DRF59_19875 [Chryseobacterium flavum]